MYFIMVDISCLFDCWWWYSLRIIEKVSKMLCTFFVLCYSWWHKVRPVRQKIFYRKEVFNVIIYVEHAVMLTLWTYYRMNRMNAICRDLQFYIPKYPTLGTLKKKIQACMQIPWNTYWYEILCIFLKHTLNKIFFFQVWRAVVKIEIFHRNWFWQNP